MSFNSRLVIFYWYVSHLLDFDITDIVSFNTKYFFPGPDLKIQYGLKIMPVPTQISCL